MLLKDKSETPEECTELFTQSLAVALFAGGKVGNRLRYAAVVVNTSLTGVTLKYKEGNEVYKNWEDFIKIEVR